MDHAKKIPRAGETRVGTPAGVDTAQSTVSVSLLTSSDRPVARIDHWAPVVTVRDFTAAPRRRLRPNFGCEYRRRTAAGDRRQHDARQLCGGKQTALRRQGAHLSPVCQLHVRNSIAAWVRICHGVMTSCRLLAKIHCAMAGSRRTPRRLMRAPRPESHHPVQIQHRSHRTRLDHHRNTHAPITLG